MIICLALIYRYLKQLSLHIKVAGAKHPSYLRRVRVQLWPESVVPWIPVGKLTCNENIKNFHNEVCPCLHV